MKRRSRREESAGGALLRAGRIFGKYRILRRISSGLFTAVYEAYDTIEGIRVALKILHAHLTDEDFLEEFRREVRLLARLDHPNILPIKNAGFIDGRFTIALPLGEQTLADRIQRRMSLRTALGFAEQALAALQHAHSRKIIHCDIKPENFIIFPGGRLRLADFGIARVARRTVEASGSGTVGYVAPEQAMGRPSFKSDVFSMGLVLYRMLSGKLPKWPFDRPLEGYERLRKRLHPDLLRLVLRAVEVEPSRRFRDAGHMLNSFRRIRNRALAYPALRRRRRKKNHRRMDWTEVRKKQFQREFGRILQARFTCGRCGGPVSEPMTWCPWCGASRRVHRDETSFPARCPRCGRGVKKDWKYCPWCYGSGFEEVSRREYTDRRYQGRCSNEKCPRRSLMPFMRYCPWCRRAVRRKWRIQGSRARCPSCGWGVLPEFWSFCPWCGRKLAAPSAGARRSVKKA